MLDRIRLCWILPTIALTVLSGTPLAALAQEYRTNLREQCRLTISDIYMSLWNEEKLYREQNDGIEKKLKLLQGERVRSEKNLEDLQKAKSKDIPEISLNHKAAALVYELDTLQAQIAELIPLAAATSKNAQSRKVQLAAFDQLIQGVFIHKPISTQTRSDSKMLAFRIDYSQECSEYDLVCPLLPPQAKQLAAIANAFPEYSTILQKPLDATLCERYSKVRRRGE